MQGEQGETGNRTIWGDVAVYSRSCAPKAGALGGWICVGCSGSTGSLRTMRRAGQGDRQAQERSQGVVAWHRAQWKPFPRRCELDSFEAPSSRLISCGDPRISLTWQEGKGRRGQLLPGSSNEQSPEFLTGAKELRRVEELRSAPLPLPCTPLPAPLLPHPSLTGTGLSSLPPTSLTSPHSGSFLSDRQTKTELPTID